MASARFVIASVVYQRQLRGVERYCSVDIVFEELIAVLYAARHVAVE